MKVVVFTSKNNIFANRIIKELFSVKGIEVVGIVESNTIYKNENNISSILKILKKSGLSYLMSQIIKFSYFKLGSTFYNFNPYKKHKHILFPYKSLAKKQNIPVFTEKDINSSELIKKISKHKPDIFFSVFMNQIFRTKLLSVPKIGTLNVHPALLPSYKGLSPIFWALSNGEKSSGITIHWVDEGIDSGDIVSQKEVKILPKDTEFSLYLRCVDEGICLLEETFSKAGKKEKLKTLNKFSSSYYSFPTKNDVKRFKQNGRRFLSLKELLAFR